MKRKMREDGKQRVEERVVENQATHNMSACGWDEMKCATHTKLEPVSMCQKKMCAVKHEKM